MSRSLDGGDDAVATQNGVTVERRLERRGDGVIVTLELTSDVRSPAEVDLVDEFPPDLPIKQAGFNVEYEPDAGEVSLDRVELEHTVEGAPAKIVYAIRFAEPVDDVAFDPPTIRDVTMRGVPDSSAPAAADGPSEGDASGEREEAEPAKPAETSGPVDETSGAEPSTDAGSDADIRSDSSSDNQGLPEGLSLDGPVGENGDTAAASSGDGASTGAADEAIADGGDDSDEITQAIETAIEGAETDGAETDGIQTDGAETDGGGPAAQNGDRSGPGDGAAPPADQAVNGSAPAEAAGGEPEPELEPGSEPRPEVPKSVRLRLDRLNARVEEFAAYAEALEGIIERHGTAPEILDAIEADLADADERLADFREEIETLESQHAADVEAHDDRLESLEARLDDVRGELESEVDGVREDVAAVDEVREDVADVSREVDALGDRLDDREADVEDLGETVDRAVSEVSDVSRNVEAMRSEMETLREDVDRLLRFREILADVFGGPVRRATEGGADPFGGSGRADPAVDRSGTDDRSGTGDSSSTPSGSSGSSGPSK